MVTLVLKWEKRKPFGFDHDSIACILFCRILCALCGSLVDRSMARSLAKRMGFTRYFIAEKIPLIATVKRVPLRGEPCGTPFSW